MLLGVDRSNFLSWQTLMDRHDQRVWRLLQAVSMLSACPLHLECRWHVELVACSSLQPSSQQCSGTLLGLTGPDYWR